MQMCFSALPINLLTVYSVVLMLFNMCIKGLYRHLDASVKALCSHLCSFIKYLAQKSQSGTQRLPDGGQSFTKRVQRGGATVCGQRKDFENATK